MAIPLQLLLRLPPTLRCQTLSQASPWTSRGSGQRLFSNTLRFLDRSKAKRPPPPKPKPSTAPPKPTTPPPKSKHATPPPPKEAHNIYLRTLLKSSDPALIYKSPSHTSYYFASYLLGTAFLVGAGQTASLMQNPGKDAPPVPFWSRFMLIVPSFLLAVLGTTFFLGPTKMIRSISVFSKEGVGPMVSFQMKSPIPFVPFKALKAKGVIDVGLKEASIVQAIKGSELELASIPLKDAPSFTEAFFNPPKKAKRGVVEQVRGFNQSLLNVWPAIRQDVRRMFLRERMAYVKISGHGNWKMDLYHCELLDGGGPLVEVMEMDLGNRRWGLGDWFRGLMT